MISKRAFLLSAGALVCVAGARPARARLPAIAMAQHERFMRLAIEEGRLNARYPFGAVIVSPHTGKVLARGVNDVGESPVLHGEMACINDYVRRNGNRGWESLMLYTTAEPCSMCMSALVWANIGGVVFGSSMESLKRAGIGQIQIKAQAVVDASPFYHGTLLGGVLHNETDRLFMERQRN